MEFSLYTTKPVHCIEAAQTDESYESRQKYSSESVKKEKI